MERWSSPGALVADFRASCRAAAAGAADVAPADCASAPTCRCRWLPGILVVAEVQAGLQLVAGLEVDLEAEGGRCLLQCSGAERASGEAVICSGVQHSGNRLRTLILEGMADTLCAHQSCSLTCCWSDPSSGRGHIDTARNGERRRRWRR